MNLWITNVIDISPHCESDLDLFLVTVGFGLASEDLDVLCQHSVTDSVSLIHVAVLFLSFILFTPFSYLEAPKFHTGMNQLLNFSVTKFLLHPLCAFIGLR